jgi:hypothetical protein
MSQLLDKIPSKGETEAMKKVQKVCSRAMLICELLAPSIPEETKEEEQDK